MTFSIKDFFSKCDQIRSFIISSSYEFSRKTSLKDEEMIII